MNNQQSNEIPPLVELTTNDDQINETTQDIRKADIKKYILKAGFSLAFPYAEYGYSGPPDCCFAVTIKGDHPASDFGCLRTLLEKHFEPVIIEVEYDHRDNTTLLYIEPNPNDDEYEKCRDIAKDWGGYDYVREGNWLPKSWSEHMKAEAIAKLHAMTTSELEVIMLHLEERDKLSYQSSCWTVGPDLLQLIITNVEPDDLVGILDGGTYSATR